MQEMQPWSLGWEGPPEKEMATHFNILAWETPQILVGFIQSMRSQRVGHDLVTKRKQRSWISRGGTTWWQEGGSEGKKSQRWSHGRRKGRCALTSLFSTFQPPAQISHQLNPIRNLMEGEWLLWRLVERTWQTEDNRRGLLSGEKFSS